MSKIKRKVLSIVLIVVLMLSVSLPAIAAEYDDYQGYGSSLYSSGDVGLLDAIMLNLAQYGVEIAKTQVPTDVESLAEDLVIERMDKDLPGIGIVKDVYDVSRASAYAFADLGKAISSADSNISKLLMAFDHSLEGAMSLIILKQTGAYEMGKRDRDTNNSVPIEYLEGLNNNNRAVSSIEELRKRADSWYIKLFYKSERSKLLKMADNLEDQIREFRPPLEWYNLGRYGDVNGGQSSGSNTSPGNTTTEPIEDGTYTMTLKNGGKALNLYATTAADSDYNGCNVTVWQVTGHATQSFRLESIGNGVYKIRSAANNRVIDVKRNDSKQGRPIEIGGNIQLWQNDDPAAQEWRINHVGNGYYSIELASYAGAVIGCVEASKNGGNVVLQKYTGSADQLWQLKKSSDTITIPDAAGTTNIENKPTVIDPPTNTNTNTGSNGSSGNTITAPIEDGTYTMILKNGGKALNLYATTAAESDRNGCNVTVWQVSGHVTQSFRLESIGNGVYKIRSAANNRVIDVKRNDSKQGRPIEIGGNIQLWQNDDPSAQEWRINHVGNGYYSIELASYAGAVIGCVAADKNGGNVVLQKYTGSADQLWQLKDSNGNIVIPGAAGKTEDTGRTVADGLSWPVDSTYSITSKFGYRNYNNFRFHDGVDIGTPIGTKIVPAQSGIVLLASDTWDSSAGLTIIIQHDNGLVTRYSHLSKAYVKKNDTITSETEFIGETGDSGGVAAHLHFSVYQSTTGYKADAAIPPLAEYWEVDKYNSNGQIIANRGVTTNNPVFILKNGSYVSNPDFVKHSDPNFKALAK